MSRDEAEPTLSARLTRVHRAELRLALQLETLRFGVHDSIEKEFLTLWIQGSRRQVARLEAALAREGGMQCAESGVSCGTIASLTAGNHGGDVFDPESSRCLSVYAGELVDAYDGLVEAVACADKPELVELLEFSRGTALRFRGALDAVRQALVAQPATAGR